MINQRGNTYTTTVELQDQTCELSTISDDQPAREFTWAELAAERAWLRSLVDMFGGKDLGVCVLSAPGDGLTLQVSSNARGLRKLLDDARWEGPVVPAHGEIRVSEESARGKTWRIQGLAHLAHVVGELAERRAAA
ncbi:hypothetical protein [Methylobacterium hispanicum]|uniref:hypothetical protein n=1 Tax=Methylobacterium hispanicum TaxID=270350 RepID=UPI002F3228A0